jgi:hypothetical protein
MIKLLHVLFFKFLFFSESILERRGREGIVEGLKFRVKK